MPASKPRIVKLIYQAYLPHQGRYPRVSDQAGILAGAVMGFAKAMGEFGATITFVANIPGQTQTLPSAIWAALQIPGGEGQAVAMVLMACAVAIGAVALSEALARRVARRISGA